MNIDTPMEIVDLLKERKIQAAKYSIYRDEDYGRIGIKGFDKLSSNQQKDLLIKMVDSEGPIHFELLRKRLCSFAGIQQGNARLTLRLQELFASLVAGRAIWAVNIFFWPRNPREILIRDRESLVSSERALKFIPPEEFQAAIVFSVANSNGEHIKIVKQKTFKLLGVTQKSEEYKLYFERMVFELIQHGVVYAEDNRLVCLNIKRV